MSRTEVSGWVHSGVSAGYGWVVAVITRDVVADAAAAAWPDGVLYTTDRMRL